MNCADIIATQHFKETLTTQTKNHQHMDFDGSYAMSGYIIHTDDAFNNRLTTTAVVYNNEHVFNRTLIHTTKHSLIFDTILRYDRVNMLKTMLCNCNYHIDNNPRKLKDIVIRLAYVACEYKCTECCLFLASLIEAFDSENN